MSCNCRKDCVIRATEISLRNGVYTITLPDNSLANLCACEEVKIGIFSSIPNDSKCNSVEVTDGTVTLPIYNIERCNCNCNCVADLWLTTLSCRTILCTRYGINSETLTIQEVKGKRC